MRPVLYAIHRGGRAAARVAAVAGGLLAWAGAAPAHASTVERIAKLDPFGSPYGAYTLVYTGSPGEANRLEIRLDPDGVTLTDDGQRLEARGCEQVASSTVRCAPSDVLTARLGDGDDVARVLYAGAVSETRPLHSLRIDGGPGFDDVTGGRGRETIVDGGAGEADRFAGGGGDDLVSYAGRRAPVRVTLGAPGEDVLDGFQNVEGGSGNDVLVGDGGANGLHGGAGADRLKGGAGADTLDGGAGPDRLEGAAGDDVLSGDDYTSGTGRDILIGGDGDDVLDLGVADDEPLSIAGPTYDPSTDGAHDSARCGAGYDVLQYPESGDVTRSCEATGLGYGWAVGHVLRRTSSTRLRLRVTSPNPVGDGVLEVVVTARGNRRLRITRKAQIQATGALTLRLTAAGRRYLSRRRAVTVASLDDGERVDAVVRG